MDRTGPIATSEYNDLEIFHSLLPTTISQALVVLTLFAGTSGWAEKALLQVIQTLELIDINSKNCVLSAIELSKTMPEYKVLALDEQEEMSLNLPPELRRVFGMPANFRQCFVLRILLGVSTNICATILDRQIDEVNESTSAAILYLAGLKQFQTTEEHAYLERVMK